MALSTTANYSLRKHDAGDLNWDVDVNWNMTEIDKKLKLLFANFLTCSTAIGTAAKTAAFSNFVLETGCLIAVKFTNGNSASGATLNVNSTGAKAIYYNGSAIPTNAIVPNGIYLLVYDGTNWVMLNPITLSDSITDGETGLAPTQNAVFDALALKADASDVADALALKADADDVINALESAVDENIPIFDGIAGDKLKDSGVKLSDKADVTAVTDGLAIKESIDNLTYNGTDLTAKFATEIAGYADVWAWIKARITAVNYAGLNIGDYIPWTLGSETIWSQIAGIDTYYRTGDTQLGHHIDFISKDCMATAYQWNTTNINNGDASNPSPYMISALKATLDGLVTSLPAGLQAQIITKRALLESRYTSGSTLINSTSWAWDNMGKLWVPTEHEVYGGIIFGTKPFAMAQTAQYPIFINSYKSRIKGVGHNGARCAWWLASVYGGTSTICCAAGTYGNPSNSNASALLWVPLCFRIG